MWPTCSSWVLLQMRMLSTQAKAASQSPDGRVHVPPEGRPQVSESNRHPLILEEVKGGGDGGLLYVPLVNRDLMMEGEEQLSDLQ